jgi:serine/threonine-protein kinase
MLEAMSAFDSLQGALAGRYRIDREIGEGGMATIYLARDIKHQRNVALKVLKPELGAVLGAERFLAEIRVTANLQHPNLLPLFDSGEAAGLLFYVMPFVEGETLRTRLQRERQLPVEEAVHIAVSLASALEYAHSHNVVHRDLKPENVFIHAGQPVIADFGIALAVSNAAGERITQSGVSIGTPQYMSPEQASSDRTLDRRSDIYSLGALTYEMLAGEPPHTGTSAQAIIAKLMTAEPQPLRAVRPAVPVHVSEAVQKALAKLPADRFSSAKQFADALTNPAFTTNSAFESQTRTRREKNLRRLLYVAASIIVLLGIATALSWRRVQPTRSLVRYGLALDPDEALDPSSAGIAISPDGSNLVYLGGPHGQLMLLPRNQLHATPIPGTEGAIQPFFSPDGTHVGFVTGKSSLKIVSLGGGPPITVTDSLVGQSGAAWGADGFIYADGDGSVGLVRVEPKPGAIPTSFTQLDTTAGETDAMFPQVLPGGNGVLFTVGYFSGPSAIAVADIPSGRHRVILKGSLMARYLSTGHLLYVTLSGAVMVVPFDLKSLRVAGVPTTLSESVRGLGYTADLAVSADGTLVYVAPGPQTNRQLVWVTRDGKSHEVDSTWHGWFSDPSISPDGTKLALTVRLEHPSSTNIWLKTLDQGPKRRLSYDGSENGFPSWTPDSKGVTFYSQAAGHYGLLLESIDGLEKRDLHVTEKADNDDSLWTPDGTWLIFTSDAPTPEAPGGREHIYATRPGVDSARLLVVEGKSYALQPTLSPDGRFLAYVSPESGRDEIYVIPFPKTSNEKWSVSNQGGTEPLWSHSGKEIFYVDGTGSMVSTRVTTTPTFSVGTTSALFPAREFLASVDRRQYSLSRDDKRFLMIRSLAKDRPDQLVVVENLFDELKKPNSVTLK